MREVIRREIRKYKSYLSIFRFLLVFLSLSLLVPLITSVSGGFLPVQRGFAGLVGAVLTWFGVSVSQNGIFLATSTALYEISFDCLGWKSLLAFFSLVFAVHPRRVLNRSFVVGLIAIMVLNFIRVVSVLAFSDRLISFPLIHNILWNWGLLIAVFVIFFVHLKFSSVSGVSQHSSQN